MSLADNKNSEKKLIGEAEKEKKMNYKKSKNQIKWLEKCLEKCHVKCQENVQKLEKMVKL